MHKYLLIAIIIFNISNCFSLKYSLPESICKNNISCIAIGDEVEYNERKQAEVSLFANGNFWYYPDTDPQNKMQGWAQILSDRIHASFRRNFFNDKTECETNTGSYRTINREFILLTFRSNQLVYDIFNISAKNFEYKPKQLFDNPVFNESNIERDKKIDAALNWNQSVVVFQGENYFIIKFNENQNCENLKPVHFGPLKISFIDNELTQVTSAIYDGSADELYIIQSDQVFINKAFINNGKISIAKKISKGNLTNTLFDCGSQISPPPIDTQTPSSSDNETNQSVNTEPTSESAVSSSESLAESSTENIVSVTPTESERSKYLVTYIIIAIIISFIIAIVICIICSFCITRDKESISKDKESGLADDNRVDPSPPTEPDRSPTGKGLTKTANIHTTNEKSGEKITPNVIDVNGKKDENKDKVIESIQIHSMDDEDIEDSDKSNESESIKSSESSLKDSKIENKDNSIDSEEPSPDKLWEYPTSPKSLGSHSWDSNDLQINKIKSDESKSGSQTSIGSEDLDFIQNPSTSDSLKPTNTTSADKSASSKS